MKTTTHHFDKLVSKALDSTITKAEGDHLRAILKEHPSFQKRYCKAILIESLFHWEEVEDSSSLDSNIITFPYWVHALSFAAVLVCLLSAWLLHDSGSQTVTHKTEDLTANISERKNANFSSKPPIYKGKVFPGESSSSDKVINKASEFINELLHPNEVNSKSSLQFKEGLAMMSIESKLSTSSMSGIMPLSDGEMIKLGAMEINPVSRNAEIVETLRVYDMTSSDQNFQTVDAVIHINQSFTEMSDATEFVLSLHALSSPRTDSLIQVESSSQTILSDNDQSTWERVDTSISIPRGTDYLVVALSARKSGPSALNAHYQEFFCDELDVAFLGI
ncbi:MAG: hypothetical protein VX038_03500 [Verrucomicrobiota bacterium]|nr:hypothetical protein [Verrucomicrobiota bacterium]